MTGRPKWHLKKLDAVGSRWRPGLVSDSVHAVSNSDIRNLKGGLKSQVAKSDGG